MCLKRYHGSIDIPKTMEWLMDSDDTFQSFISTRAKMEL